MRKVFQRLLAVLVLVPLICALSVASAADTTLNFTVPQGVTFQLYAAAKNFGSTTGTKVSATSSATAGGITTYSYAGLAAGNYYYTASGDGYYTVKKNVYYSAAEAAVGGTIDANPGRLAGNNFEPTGGIVVNDHTDELNAAANQSAANAWPGYEQIFDTPYFTRPDYAQRMATGDGKHQQTTQEEMMAFLDQVDDENDDVYTYILGQSPVYNYDIPILIFTKTDLSGAQTLEEAAALVRANEKLTFHISAEVHSDEPASGEMALAMIDELDKEYGQELMETINIYVIPRINPDGAHAYVRTNMSQGIDMNRDYMYARTEEVAMILRAKQLFMAEVAVDEHEFNIHDHQQRADGTQTLPDLYIGQSGSQNNEAVTNDLVNEVIDEVFEAGYDAGIRPFYYPPYTTAQYNRGRGHYSLNGTVGVLFESRGINYGMHMIERRVYSLYVGTERMLEWAVENHERIKAQVAQARADIVAKGETYDADDVLVLEHEKVPVTQARKFPRYNMATGEMTSENVTAENRTMLEAKTTRVRPTAYVIPDGNRWTKDALTVFDKHGISYYKIPAGAGVQLQQYKGDEYGAELLAETLVQFPDGAYVLPMNQVEGTVLGLLMEPDILDVNGSDGPDCSLVQCGIVNSAADGTLPIYRYIHDLEDGEIAVDLGAVDTQRDDHGEGWTAISSSYEITQPGNYYLTADITGSVTVGSSNYGIAVSADNVTLCLHGYNIPAVGRTGALRSAGNNVTLCNCTSEGGKINNTALRSVLVTGGSLTMGDNVHLDDAVITRTEASQALAAIQVNDGASFTMNGGTIRGNDLTHNGANCYAAAVVAIGTAEVNLTGGKICGNAVTTTSGTSSAVKAGTGRLTISGTVMIEDNRLESTNNGGTIVVDESGATVTMTGGSISGNKGTFGRGVLITKGTFTLSGGGIANNEAQAKPGGGVHINGGTFNMTGGTIRGNSSVSSTGGGVVLYSGKFNMSGGTITGNYTTSAYGGGLSVRTGEANISGGTIAGNLLNNSAAYGVDVSCGYNGTSGGTLTISGGTIGENATGRNLTVCSGTTILKGNAVVNGSVGVVGVTGTATLRVQEDAHINGSVVNSLVGHVGATTFKATTVEISGGSVAGSISVDTTPHEKEYARGTATTTISGGKFSQSPKASFLASGCTVTDSGDNALPYAVVQDVPDPTVCALHGSHAGWTAIDNSRNTSITAGGNYYLTENITTARGGSTTGALNFVGGSDGTAFTLCLNGHSILVPGTTKGVMSAVRMERGTLTIVNGIKPELDVDGNPTSGLIRGSGNYTKDDGSNQTNGRAFQIGINGGGPKTVTICDNVHVNGTTTTGAPIFMYSDGVLNMQGGTISGNTGGSGMGGAIRMAGIMTMTGGTISNNSTSGNGGAVYVCQDGTNTPGSFTMSGGTISGNTAKQGGGVYVVAGASFEMTGGTISGNKATDSSAGSVGGGGVFVAGTFTLSGEGKISENAVAGGGGGVNVAEGATFRMNGGTISGNTHNGGSGGGAGLLSMGASTMTGGTITGNKILGSSGNGGGVYQWSGTFTMTGGTICDNSGDMYAGGVVVRQGTFTMQGGTIRGNTLKANGGRFGLQVCVGVNSTSSSTSNCFFVMEGGTIDAGGTSGYDLAVLRATATIRGGTVIGNVGTVGAGGAAAILNIQGGAIDGEVTNGTWALPTGTNRGKCTTTITGGKFSADMTRDELAVFLPQESNEMTTVYSIANYKDPDEKLVYQAVAGLYSETEDKFMDFGSSLDLGVVLNAHRNFDPDAFADGFTVSATTANKTYGAAFDTTTVPGSLILMAHGIAAKEMHDAITFTVKKGDVVWYEETLSVYDVAKLWHGDGDTSDQRMLADMIAYGNEARKEFKYNMAGQPTLPTLSGASGYTPAWNATQGGGVTDGYRDKVALTLSLKEKVQLNVYINDKAAQISNVKLAGSDYDASNYTVDTSSGSYTRICFHNIPVAKVKDAVAFTVTMSSGETFEVKYSIADYAILAKDGEQSALIRSLMRYVDGVRAFLGVVEEEDYMILNPGEDETEIFSPWG